jgi:hypothetical protein
LLPDLLLSEFVVAVPTDARLEFDSLCAVWALLLVLFWVKRCRFALTVGLVGFYRVYDERRDESEYAEEKADSKPILSATVFVAANDRGENPEGKCLNEKADEHINWRGVVLHKRPIGR